MAIGSISKLVFGENIDFESPYKLYENWKASPQQIAAYLQGKFSFNQMIMNLGARIDYFSAGGKNNIFNEFDQFFTQQNNEDREDRSITVKAKKQIELSPRIGISFPITEQTKFYFNYGHFSQMQQAQYPVSYTHLTLPTNRDV